MRARESTIVLVVAPLSLALIVFPIVKEDVPLGPLYASLGFSLLAFASTMYLIPAVGPLFIQRNLKGRDLLKSNRQEMYACLIFLWFSADFPLIFRPECMGLVCACIYTLFLILFIPFSFADFVKQNSTHTSSTHLPLPHGNFPHQQVEFPMHAAEPASRELTGIWLDSWPYI
jgi:UDP-N-acetylglucosamine--dolichyl-phosphate N-acetylglucosaminephosphotransferase